MHFKNACLTWLLIFSNCCSFAALAIDKEQLILTQCMLDKIQAPHTLVSQSGEMRLVEMDLTDEVLQKLHHNKKACGGFINLEAYSPASRTLNNKQRTLTKPFEPVPIKHDEQVHQLYQLVDGTKIWQTSQHLTSYINRSSKTKTGIIAAHWFKNQFDSMAKEYGRTDVESKYIDTGRYKQPSVLALIGKGNPEDALVIGAHIDTLSGSMPGADDDGSGISVTLEIARVLLASPLKFDRPIYIIAYAAEENGMVGSSFVVKHFIEQKIPVKAVMQLDQSGYRANPKNQTIWLLKDYVDSSLTKFIAELLTHYVKVPVAYTKCNYACSDHVSWYMKGFSASYPSATDVEDDNPFIHTSEDKLDILNQEHMLHFTQLGLAFVAELGLK